MNGDRVVSTGRQNQLSGTGANFIILRPDTNLSYDTKDATHIFGWV